MSVRGGIVLSARIVSLLTVCLFVLASAGFAKPNNSKPGVLGFAKNNYRVAEHAGMASVSVERKQGDDGAVSVQYSASAGSADDGTDFHAVSGTLSWSAGDRGQKSFVVPILDDFLLEGNDAQRIMTPRAVGHNLYGRIGTRVGLGETPFAGGADCLLGQLL